jgi:GTP-binding protein
VPAPDVDPDGPLQMQISTLDYNSFVGAIAVGRISAGAVKPNTAGGGGQARRRHARGQDRQVYGYLGLERTEVPEAGGRRYRRVTGIEAPERLRHPVRPAGAVEALPALTVDEPTVSMTFQVNDLAVRRQGGQVRHLAQLKERLERELIHNVALRVEEGDDPDKFRVSGRGELHLSILIENMRREGYELASRARRSSSARSTA